MARKKGFYSQIQVTKKDRELSNQELQKKYGISRTTAWRIRTGKINKISILLKEATKIEDKVFEQFSEKDFNKKLFRLNRLFPYLDIEDLKDILAENRLKLISNYKNLKNDIEALPALWWIWSKKDALAMAEKKKKFEHITIKNEKFYSNIL